MFVSNYKHMNLYTGIMKAQVLYYQATKELEGDLYMYTQPRVYYILYQIFIDMRNILGLLFFC